MSFSFSLPPPRLDPFVWFADTPFFDATSFHAACDDLRWIGGVYVVADRHIYTGFDDFFYVGQSVDIGARLREHKPTWLPYWEAQRLGDLVVFHHVVGGDSDDAIRERLRVEYLVRQELRPRFGLR